MTCFHLMKSKSVDAKPRRAAIYHYPLAGAPHQTRRALIDDVSPPTVPSLWCCYRRRQSGAENEERIRRQNPSFPAEQPKAARGRERNHLTLAMLGASVHFSDNCAQTTWVNFPRTPSLTASISREAVNSGNLFHLARRQLGDAESHRDLESAKRSAHLVDDKIATATSAAQQAPEIARRRIASAAATFVSAKPTWMCTESARAEATGIRWLGHRAALSSARWRRHISGESVHPVRYLLRAVAQAASRARTKDR